MNLYSDDPWDNCIYYIWASLVAQMVKNLPAIRETWARSLGWEDPLEEGMITHSSILAWRIPMDRGAWQATVHGVAKSWTRLSDTALSTWDNRNIRRLATKCRFITAGVFQVPFSPYDLLLEMNLLCITELNTKFSTSLKFY